MAFFTIIGADLPNLRPSTAEPTEREQARQKFEEAKQFYIEGKFEKALAAFQEAYSLGHALNHPENLLFNIGECYRMLGKNEEALQAYEKYLAAASDPPEAQKLIIAQLKEELAKQKKEQKDQFVPSAPVDNRSFAVETAATPPPFSYKIPKWISLGLGTLSLVGAGFSYWKAVQKNHEYADRIDQLVGQREILGDPGSYHYASEAAKQRHAAELDKISSDMRTDQKFALTFLIGGIAFAGAAVTLFVLDRKGKTKLSAGLQGVAQPKLQLDF